MIGTWNLSQKPYTLLQSISFKRVRTWRLFDDIFTSPFSCSRYPFHGQEHTGLFAKIRRGHFSLPDTLSSRAKCLIRCLLRKEPEERLNTEDVLIHPWMTQLSNRERYRRSVTSATVAASLSTTTGSTAATNPSSSGWSGASQAASASTVLTPSANVASGGIGTSNLSVGGYSYENHDQVVPDCVVPDLMDVDKNWDFLLQELIWRTLVKQRKGQKLNRNEIISKVKNLQMCCTSV